MRIGLVLAANPPYSETFFRNKIRILTEKGYTVILLVDQQKGQFDDCAVRYGFSGNLSNPVQIIKAFTRLCLNLSQTLSLFNANRNDGFSFKRNLISLFTSAHMLGQSFDWLHFGFSTLAIGRENTAKAIGASMAVSVRGSDLHTYPLQHPGCYNLVWKRIDRLHHISNYLLHLAIKEGFDNNKSDARLICPAIDTELFKAPCNHPGNTKPVFLTVARLHWIKGIEYILDALALLKQQHIDFEYHIIGEGDDFRRLFFAAHQLKLTDCVFFHGKQSQMFINKQLSIADLFIMYSLDEGFCNSVLEAQAMGCLTVVSNNAALMENVIDGETGWVVPGRNASALASSIIRILATPTDELNLIRNKAILRVKSDFNLERQKEGFVQFYED